MKILLLLAFIFDSCRSRIIYPGPYEDSGGMVPFKSSELPGVDSVKLQGVDHGETVLNLPYETLKRVRLTDALLKLLLWPAPFLTDKLQMKLTFVMIFLFFGCGKFEESLSKLNPLTPISNSINNVSSNALETPSITITPGSYYGLVMEDGLNKDIIVHEFQYLSDESFIIKETRFLSGNVFTGYFHSTTGTYKEENGEIKHIVKKNSCDKLDSFSLVFSGNKSNIVKTTHESKTLSLYTFSKFTPPAPLLNQLGNSVEDVGCQRFP